MRWILVDRFLEFDGAERARAVKNVSMGEDFTSDHYPGYPVLPPSLALEALAQAGGILVARADNFAHKVILARVDRADFGEPARPGDTVELEVEVVERRAEGFRVHGRATVADRPEADGPVADAHLLFVNLAEGQDGAEVDQNFVFTPEFMALFRGLDAGAGSSS